MGQSDWLGFGNREAFQAHLQEQVVQHTSDITIEEARRQYDALVFTPSRLYVLRSDLHNNHDGTLTDRLSLQRISLGYSSGESNQEDINLCDITVTFQKGDNTHIHNGQHRPQADAQQVRKAYETLARRIAMIEGNITGGLALANTEHLNGMYDLSQIGVCDLPTPYCTPDQRSIEYALQQRRTEGGAQPPQFPHIA